MGIICWGEEGAGSQRQCIALLLGDEKGAESEVRASAESILGQAKIMVTVMHQNAYPPSGTISRSEV